MSGGIDNGHSRQHAADTRAGPASSSSRLAERDTKPPSLAASSSSQHAAPSPTVQASPKMVVPPGWRLVTSNSTGKVYWYNKMTGKSTWQPPPGSILSQDSLQEGDGLPAQPAGGKHVMDAEGTPVPYAFAKPVPNGNWLTMRKEEAAAGRDSQRILLCAFEVDRVGMVSDVRNMRSPAYSQACALG